MDQFTYVITIRKEFRNKEKWTEKQNQIVSDHFQYLLNLKNENKLVIAGETAYEVDQDENFGIVILVADSIGNARRLMQNDPAVQHNLMSADLHPFRLTIEKR